MSYQPVNSEIPAWTFGDRLRKVRRVAGLTMDQLAEALGVTKGAIGQYETDKSRPKDIVAAAKRIQVLTGVPASWMLGLDEERPTPGGEGLSKESFLSESNRRPFHYKTASVLDFRRAS